MFQFSWPNPVKALPFTDSIQLRCSLCGDPPPVESVGPTFSLLTSYLVQISKKISVHRDCLSCASYFKEIKPDIAYSEDEVQRVIDLSANVECVICTIGGATVKLEEKNYHLNCIKKRSDILEKLTMKQTGTIRTPLKPSLKPSGQPVEMVVECKTPEPTGFLDVCSGDPKLKSKCEKVRSVLTLDQSSDPKLNNKCERIRSALSRRQSSDLPLDHKRTRSPGKENSGSKVILKISKRGRSREHQVESPGKKKTSTKAAMSSWVAEEGFSADRHGTKKMIPKKTDDRHLTKKMNPKKMIDDRNVTKKMIPKKTETEKRLSNDSGVSIQSDSVRYEISDMAPSGIFVEEKVPNEDPNENASSVIVNNKRVNKTKISTSISTSLPTTPAKTTTTSPSKTTSTTPSKTSPMIPSTNPIKSSPMIPSKTSLTTPATHRKKRLRERKPKTSNLNVCESEEEKLKVKSENVKTQNLDEQKPKRDISSNKSIEDGVVKKARKLKKNSTESCKTDEANGAIKPTSKKSKSNKVVNVKTVKTIGGSSEVVKANGKKRKKNKQEVEVMVEGAPALKRKLKKVLVNHKQKPRTFYSVSLNLPTSPSYNDDVRDLDWIKTLQSRSILQNEYLNEGEKSFVSIWNEHISRLPCYGDRMAKENLEAFVNKFGVRIYREHLYRNFLLHLSNMVEFSIISPTIQFQIIVHMQKLFRRIIEEPDSFSQEADYDVEEDVEEDDPVNEAFYNRQRATHGEDDPDNFKLYLSDDEEVSFSCQVPISGETNGNSPSKLTEALSPNSRSSDKYHSAMKATLPHTKFNPVEDVEVDDVEDDDEDVDDDDDDREVILKPFTFAKVHFVDDNQIDHHIVDQLNSRPELKRCKQKFY